MFGNSKAMADKEHHPKSLLNRYGTILRWIKEICNQGDRFVWNKPQADHSETFAGEFINTTPRHLLNYSV